MQEGVHIDKVWGVEHILTNRPKYCAKILEVHGGMSCSRHRHRIKEETFIVLAGAGWIEMSMASTALSEPLRLQVGSFVHLEPGMWHRFWTEENLIMLEVSTNHSDEDVERQQESGEVDSTDISDTLAYAVSYLRELLTPVEEI